MSEFVQIASSFPPNDKDPAALRQAVQRLQAAMQFAARNLPRVFYVACAAASTTILLDPVPQSMRVANAWFLQTNVGGGGDTVRLYRTRSGSAVALTNATVITAVDKAIQPFGTIDYNYHNLLGGDTIDCRTTGTVTVVAYLLCVPN